MDIPLSPYSRPDLNAPPPPLPPPKNPLTDPCSKPDTSRFGGYPSGTFGPSHASGGSGYGSLASDGWGFRPDFRPARDEGYSSLSTSRPRDPAPASQFLSHNSFSFRSYGDSVKDKLNPSRSHDSRPQPPPPPPPLSALSISLSAENAQPMLPLRRSLLSGCPPLSAPARPHALLEDPERFMQTPVHTMVPPSPFWSHPGERPPQDAIFATDHDRSPRRARRTDSSSIPDDMTESTQTSVEEGDMEVARLSIDDARSDYYPVAGQKRRASSPAGEDLLPNVFAHQPDSGFFRRREMPARGSPAPRLSAMHQGSFSSVSSAGRSNSWVSTLGPSTGLPSPMAFGRRSPVPFSPGGGMSPHAVDPNPASFGPPMALVSSPRVTISRIVSPHQRSVADSRALPSPRKLTNVPRPAGPSTGMQEFYMCECCPKKPKKFDTLEELSAHEAQKQYECQFCGNRFKNKNEAERHQNSLHVRPHSWSCSALTTYERAYHESTLKPGLADTCGYCGLEFERHGEFTSMASRGLAQDDWDQRVRHLQEVHKFKECNSTKKFYRADHFRQHLKHSHAGTSGKWTNMLENACMIDEGPAAAPN